MPTQDTSGIKEKIINALQKNGPSLPIHIARETGQSMLFASAFLSELLSEKKIKISNMKVGGTPVYYIPGQETKLEKYFEHLNHKEKEAFTLLKENKFLKDSAQEPPIRVALRSLRDFAIPFRNNQDQEIYWRFLTADISEFNKPKQEDQEQKEQKEIKKEPEDKSGEKKEDKQEQENKPEPHKEETEKKEEEKSKKQEQKEPEKESKEEKPLLKIKEKKSKKKKEKSEFVQEVLEKLAINDIEVLEELDYKKREFHGLGRINSDIGKIELYIFAKDKKKITDTDLTIVTQKAQIKKRIALMVSKGELNKKAQEYLKRFKTVKYLQI